MNEAKKHVEVRYGHHGDYQGETGLWIGVTVANVPQAHKAEIETILEQTRDDLVALLGLD
jgi:hypothetical protein